MRKQLAAHFSLSFLLCRYGGLGTAAAESDGLAVLGVFFRLQKEDNPVLTPLFDAISVTKTPGTSKTLSKVMPLKVRVPLQMQAYRPNVLFSSGSSPR